MPVLEHLPAGRLYVRASNVGRRALTIEEIFLQVFPDELEELRTTPLARVGKMKRIEYVAIYAFKTPKDFPLKLVENQPITVEIILAGLDREKLSSTRRLCAVRVTGRKKPATIRCIVPGEFRQTDPKYFSGS